MTDAQDMLELAQARVGDVAPDADLLAMAVSFNLIRAADRLARDLEDLHRPAGWTWPGFRIVFWIWLLGPLEPRQIASLASASRASISSALKTLERDGFVDRDRDSNDGRLVTVTLTDAGRNLIGGSFRSHNEREQEWVAVFTIEERETLARLLGKLLDHVPPRLCD